MNEDALQLERRLRRFLGRIGDASPEPAFPFGSPHLITTACLVALFGLGVGMSALSLRLGIGHHPMFDAMTYAAVGALVVHLAHFLCARSLLKAVACDRRRRHRCFVCAAPLDDGRCPRHDIVIQPAPRNRATPITHHAVQSVRLSDRFYTDPGAWPVPSNETSASGNTQSTPDPHLWGRSFLIATACGVPVFLAMTLAKSGYGLLATLVLTIMFAGFLVVLPAIGGCLRYICLHRQLSGRCWRCGYDLDASPHAIVCPECAEPVATSKVHAES